MQTAPSAARERLRRFGREEKTERRTGRSARTRGRRSADGEEGNCWCSRLRAALPAWGRRHLAGGPHEALAGRWIARSVAQSRPGGGVPQEARKRKERRKHHRGTGQQRQARRKEGRAKAERDARRAGTRGKGKGEGGTSDEGGDGGHASGVTCGPAGAVAAC